MNSQASRGEFKHRKKRKIVGVGVGWVGNNPHNVKHEGQPADDSTRASFLKK